MAPEAKSAEATPTLRTKRQTHFQCSLQRPSRSPHQVFVDTGDSLSHNTSSTKIYQCRWTQGGNFSLFTVGNRFYHGNNNNKIERCMTVPTPYMFLVRCIKAAMADKGVLLMKRTSTAPSSAPPVEMVLKTRYKPEKKAKALRRRKMRESLVEAEMELVGEMRRRVLAEDEEGSVKEELTVREMARGQLRDRQRRWRETHYETIIKDTPPRRHSEFHRSDGQNTADSRHNFLVE
ncbi:hypothetical protein QJS10_CPB11g01817 [Acorus calamus]|uniref:Uncharacterized protein n=1 Tax=Acorus calamus TaxID=4465 RepID=A0AAV9DWQ7_ACOCL|nr:hypothetical protein QJS10_CPB11g01817 [Acorus calamus]